AVIRAGGDHQTGIARRDFRKRFVRSVGRTVDMDAYLQRTVRTQQLLNQRRNAIPPIERGDADAQ
ncbi:hypothetical protein, partial [Mesorhizobium sp. M7A.F.Ca.CA.004.04.2.1]|uniref:hypothetical protein n=1 Tax=Mesorhizobium sp. M7A.F.Ca.CA.004.04.2.1 TaxID=2496677 RepID=UPI001FDFF7C0